jgi:acyl carrier protein
MTPHNYLTLVLESLAALKPGETIHADTDLIDGSLIDSFDLVLLVADLEARTGLQVPGEAIHPMNFRTPTAIAMLLSSRVV